MKVILQKSVDKLGDPGDVAEVADGYARNYLIPGAWPSGPRRAPSSKPRRSNEVTAPGCRSRRWSSKRSLPGSSRRALYRSPLARVKRASLFGSVTAADIAEAVTAQAGVAVDRRDVHLEEPIRSIGTHEVRVKLFHEVEPVITVEVVAEG